MDKSRFVLVNIAKQKLTVLRQHEIVCTYSISTSKFGVGEEYGSEKTPRGWHIIREKIGKDFPINTVFVARHPTGELYSAQLAKKYFGRDWILTRILWLSGLEEGKNYLGNCDTMRRYIYIHGVPDMCLMGVPSSRGCINMHNQDIIELFDLVSVSMPVLIQEM